MRPFEERYQQALEDPGIAQGLLAFQRGWSDSRGAQIAELEQLTGRGFDELRAEFAEVKERVRADWRGHLDRFQEQAEAAGATVVRVQTPGEVNDYVGRLARDRQTTVAVKGKSMVTEETGLNEHLEGLGIAAVETDLGEWLLQLAGEHPSHLVMPAIHKRAAQIAELLERVLGRPFSAADIGGMVAAARTELRERFLVSGLGITGANALVAEGGSVLLICNEGNNRMSVALPPVHVVVAGIEKLVPTYADAMRQVRLLARSATGQPITTYTSFVTGPRPGQEQHILLLDGGRSEMGADPDISSALGCIRCGACANVCPPYQVVGGHAFGHVYTGAIGLVNTPYHHGLEAAAGPQSLCVQCGACATVCPADIPLPEQILRVRRDAYEAGLSSPLWRVAMRLLRSRRLVGAATRAAAVAGLPWRRDGFARLPARGPLARQVSWRSAPAVPLRPARSRLAAAARADGGGARVASALDGREVTLFIQCLTDRLSPGIAVSAAELLTACGARVEVPRSQHCCGLPAYDAGDWRSAAAMAKQTIRTLEAAGGDVVTPAPSCAAAIRHDYPRLLREEPAWVERAARLGDRVHDLVSYLDREARLPAGALAADDGEPVTVHRFCQSGNSLGHTDEMERLLRDVCRVPVRPLPENGVCCGFGGSTSLTAPEAAAGVLDRKLSCVDETGAGTLVTDNPGCVLHMRGGADASGRSVSVVHIAEFLAGRLPAEGERRAGR